MSIIGIAWLLACAIGAPALLGLWSTRLYYDRLDKYSSFSTPAGITIGISLVVAACAAAALEPAITKAVGEWAKLSGIFAAAMFAVGITIGWIECRNNSKK
jgi:hypothetical protein